MKVAFNIFPLKSGHKNRGIGYYTANLLSSLKKDPSLTIQEFEDISEVKQADVVHYPWFDLFYKTLKIKNSFPTIVTIHDVIPLVFPKHYPIGVRGKINFFFQKRALNKCNAIITDSIASKKDILQYLKVTESKVKVIPLAADKSFFILKDTDLIRVKRKYNFPDQFLLYVGDANWVKNLPFLIENFRKLKSMEGFDKLKLILIGGAFLKKVENIDHPELKSLKQVNRLISSYNLEDFIVRLGRIEDNELCSIYNLATVYIQPSIYEGFGLPVLQSFSCGTPVLSSNCGSLPEVGGNAAVYFNPNNSEQFISTLIEILENKSLQYKLSKLGLEQVSKFSWEQTTLETKNEYLNAIKKK